ncbi:hypothetical protein ABIF68_007807 [Bradyrhizobium japonicum]|uniref:hypothetical protein n=1 Tax=Bradyrhizobium TaxID=374 RepID=UPI0004B85127|nr:MULTISPECIES: hypothetical protein [Bradyrhizobium]MBR0946685.1 hypothetical protein [Bradyrhizobium liaoningense]MDI2071503.1 hypothetical protein [Bradyrhizobium sp. Mp27]
MDIDIDALEAAALAATPGQWEWNGDTLMAGKDYVLWPGNVLNPIDGIPLTWAERLGSCGETTESRAEANARLIAAASPAVVLELVRRLKAARSLLSEVDEHNEACTIYLQSLGMAGMSEPKRNLADRLHNFLQGGA